MRILVIFIAFLITTGTAFSSVNQEITADNTIKLLSEASQYTRITGKIVSTDFDSKSKVVFLNFGNNYNTSLSALIYQDALHDFENAGIFDPAAFFKRKDVVLEGIIRISNGKPEIIIDSPTQIKIKNNDMAYTKTK
ncbi:MAG: hypothetical protein WCK67_06110 [bacterium]